MARAICGSARRTAAATVASSSFMSRTISSDDIWSSFDAALRICSVVSCRRSDFGPLERVKSHAFQGQTCPVDNLKRKNSVSHHFREVACGRMFFADAAEVLSDLRGEKNCLCSPRWHRGSEA